VPPLAAQQTAATLGIIAFAAQRQRTASASALARQRRRLALLARGKQSGGVAIYQQRQRRNMARFMTGAASPHGARRKHQQ